MFNRCPKCGSAEISDGICQACGFPAGKVNQVMMQAYLITGAMAMSVLIYAAIAVAVTAKAEVPGSAPQFLPVILLVLAIVDVAIGIMVALSAHKQPTVQQMFGRLIVSAAMAESAAIMGLVLTLLTKDMKWIAVFTVISLVGFVVIGREMPAFAKAVVDYVDQHPGEDLNLGRG